MNYGKIVLFGLLAALTIPAYASSSSSGSEIEPVKVKCDLNRPIEENVIVERNADGDTISVKAKAGVYSIRLLGIDTPETHFQGHSQGEWGDAASERMQELLPQGTKVRLELSPTPCDMYGRVLAHVFTNKMHVNQVLVKEGLAVNYCMFPSLSHCEELGDLTAKAMRAKIGMFSDPHMELPYDFRRRIRGNEPTYFVGSLRTKKVLTPTNLDKVPVADRVFFSGRAAVKPPFYIEE